MRRNDNVSLLKRCRKHLLRSADNVLLEAATGVKPLSPAELKAMSDILTRERPTAFNIMNTMANMYDYIQSKYEGTEADVAVVTAFLAEFHVHAVAEMVRSEGSLKDGLTLQEGLPA